MHLTGVVLFASCMRLVADTYDADNSGNVDKEEMECKSDRQTGRQADYLSVRQAGKARALCSDVDFGCLRC